GQKLGSIGDAGAFSLQYFKIITSGEGGMVTTNDRIIYERAAMQHDSAMIFWERDMFKNISPFAGENYRMNEIQGALGLVQFSRIDDILSQLRLLKKLIVNEIQTIDAIELQDIPDPAGDCSVSVCFFLPDTKMTKKFSSALKAEGIPNGSIFDKEIPDRHIYYYWDYVMNKTTSDRNGCPWTCPYYKGQVSYSREQCPQTLDYLNRTIAIPLGQRMTTKHAEMIVEGIRKVSQALL
ncbi:DegT/DnrJ/EryC1/StrS family aminotransferase, partial [candidate division KSB1 bacterium]|nr:DegT/DnrJ/EryC1/StrS family aminotransferase [candidate division KSB1 bacterium]